MTLTKKRPETEIAIVTSDGHTFATAKQILSWKEDAEKYREHSNTHQLTPNGVLDLITEHKKLYEIVERLKKLPMGLILQHIRDSYSYDKHVMRKEAQEKTEKCLQDLRELKKLLGEEK